MLVEDKIGIFSLEMSNILMSNQNNAYTCPLHRHFTFRSFPTNTLTHMQSDIGTIYNIFINIYLYIYHSVVYTVGNLKGHQYGPV